jgi:soluble lytic murein transglycosylase
MKKNNRLILLTVFFLTFVGIFYSHTASAEEIDGKEYFSKGLNDIGAGRYDEAIKNFSMARKAFRVLEDYALFYLSDAYCRSGEHLKSLESIRELIKSFPQSPLIKKARTSEIREVREVSGEDINQLFEAYVKDYPDDEEMNYMYGMFLKDSGEKQKANAVFKNIYIKGGALSNTVCQELKPSDIKSTDLLKRAENLIKRYDFVDAEHDLRKALVTDRNINRVEILKNLGLALFRQKKYREAASVYDKINDTYTKARSLYRAGDKQGFDSALKELVSKNDPKAGFLLIAVASDKRREKDFEGALKGYSAVLKAYPSEAEEAEWGIGWTCYISGEYRKSAEIFSSLYSKYDDPKYLYWQARSLESYGENPSGLYNSLLKIDNNFYSALSYAKTGEKALTPASLDKEEVNGANDRTTKFERIDALQSLGLSKELVAELISLSKKIDSPSVMIYAVSKFHELGEHKRSIALATKFPYSYKLHDFWYPRAYWETVREVSEKHDIDPFVVLSVIREESRFDAEVKSVAGARGLMQIMPGTAYRLDKNLKLGIHSASEIHNVRNNVSLGVYYLKSLFAEFEYLASVLAAYNAGEIVVRKWEQNGNYRSVDEFIEDIPYPETRNYVKKVITSYFQYKKYSGTDQAGKNFKIVLGKM